MREFKALNSLISQISLISPIFPTLSKISERATLRGEIVRLSLKSRWSINKHVTPRRGTHGGGECVELICPDVGVFRCLYAVAEWLYFVAVRDVASVGISKATLTMVDRHRIA